MSELDPAMAELVALMSAGDYPRVGEDVFDAAEARRLIKKLEQSHAPEGEPVGDIRNIVEGEDGAPVNLRVYRPANAVGALPILVWYHGGGWVVGDLDSHDPVCRLLCNRIGCVVVSVDYRRAPEAKFPAAAEDAYAALCWAHDHGDDIGGDPTRLGVCGDSAGGNLSAAVSLMTRDREGPTLAVQVLLYPVTDDRFDTPSYTERGEGCLLTRANMVWFWDQYLARPEDGSDPYASPLQAGSLAGVAPAVVITAEFDPLRDEGRAYGRRLREEGVDTLELHYDGVIHGFFGLPGIKASDEAVATTCAFVRTVFALE